MNERIENQGTKYEPMNAPVVKNGGNDAIHDGVVTEEKPSNFYGKGDPQIA